MSTQLASSSSKFFNRSIEVRSLVHKVTECHPGLILVTGPPDSGKTCVLQKVIKDSRDRCQWFHMDMRQPGNSWDNIPSMYNSLYRAFAINSSCYFKSISAFKMTASIPESFTFKLKFWLPKKSTPDADDVKKLLFAIERKIVEKNRWRNSACKPVIFLDEANHMYGYLDNTAEGKVILKCFMDFIQRNTKQDGNFHVILASSSSLFVRQIMKDSISRSSIFVIGDLSKQHAVEYWKWLQGENKEKCSSPRKWVEDKNKEKCSNSAMQFEKVYKRVGGHMFDLRKVFTSLDPKNELDQMVAIARTELTSLVIPEPNIGWNKEQGEEIAKGLRDRGYMEVRPLQGKHGSDMLDAMIKENVICYRPGPVWNDDLNLQDPSTVEYPIITAPTPLHLWVLKNDMKELSGE